MTTTLHIKTDKKIKEQAEKLAKANGITLTALVNISLRNTVAKPSLVSVSPTVDIEAWKAFAGSMKGRLPADPVKWQRGIRKDRKLV